VGQALNVVLSGQPNDAIKKLGPKKRKAQEGGDSGLETDFYAARKQSFPMDVEGGGFAGGETAGVLEADDGGL